MQPACYPISVLPHLSRLFAAALAGEAPSFFPHGPADADWMREAATAGDRTALCALLDAQGERFGAGEAARANLQKLRAGARAVVTGQQVGLFGGPLLTLLKAATAVARSQEAERLTGVPHVPVFWLATEDHDLAEVDQATLPLGDALETVRLGLRAAGGEVGSVALEAAALEPGLAALHDALRALPNGAATVARIEEAYRPGATLGEAFGTLLTGLFAAQGLLVMDAAGRAFHALARPLFAAAIERAAELEAALLERTAALEAAGYHAQVLVKPGASLLFLLSSAGVRQPLRRLTDGTWKAGAASYTAADLLELLGHEPERLSPNALLRPLFQDTLLPTAAYVGGPAEIAYWAQSAVLYERLLGRVTPILPRFSATLVTPAVAAVLHRHEVALPDVFATVTAEELAVRLGARAMPIERKRALAAAGNALDAELTALLALVEGADAGLARSATVAGSKMRYQMNRMRRLLARFETERHGSLRKHAARIVLELFPEKHPQERLLAGVWFCAQDAGLIERLVAAAADSCPGHTVLPL